MATAVKTTKALTTAVVDERVKFGSFGVGSCYSLTPIGVVMRKRDSDHGTRTDNGVKYPCSLSQLVYVRDDPEDV